VKPGVDDKIKAEALKGRYIDNISRSFRANKQLVAHTPGCTGGYSHSALSEPFEDRMMLADG